MKILVLEKFLDTLLFLTSWFQGLLFSWRVAFMLVLKNYLQFVVSKYTWPLRIDLQ